MKANNASNYESVKIIVTKEKYPIIFENKVLELIKGGSTREDAEKFVEGLELELELYYRCGWGLWGVESEAVDALPYGSDISCPYTGEVLEAATEETED